jgi:hypothetical protein
MEKDLMKLKAFSFYKLPLKRNNFSNKLSIIQSLIIQNIQILKYVSMIYDSKYPSTKQIYQISNLLIVE